MHPQGFLSASAVMFALFLSFHLCIIYLFCMLMRSEHKTIGFVPCWWRCSIVCQLAQRCFHVVLDDCNRKRRRLIHAHYRPIIVWYLNNISIIYIYIYIYIWQHFYVKFGRNLIRIKQTKYVLLKHISMNL